MDAPGTDLINRFYAALAANDIAALVELYSPDARVIRFNGTSKGAAEIADHFAEMRTEHEPYALQSIDQVTMSGDVLMWDALVNTSKGVLETVEVLVLDGDGKIRRHVPGLLGYWGM